MEIKELVGQIQAKHAEIDAGIAKTGAEAAAGKAAAEKALDEVKTLGNRILEAEQKLADRVKAGSEAPATLGKSLLQSEAIKDFIAQKSSRGVFESKAPLVGQSAPGVSDSSVVAPDRMAGIVGNALRPITLLDLIPSIPTSSNLVQYSKESFFNNGAAMRGEGQASGESEIGFELAQTPVQSVASHIRLSREILGDSPQLAAYVDTRLVHGLRMKLEDQIAAGNGTGLNLSGMTNSGNFTVFAPTAGETALDSINRAIEAVQLAFYTASVVVLNPADWYALSRIKNSLGDYIIGNPVGGMLSMNLWGVTVVASHALAAGHVLVCSLAAAYSLFENGGITIEMFTQDADNATKGLITVRAATRAALASFRPASSRYGVLTA